MSNDAAGDGILEGATFCKVNDDKRPGLVPANPDGPAQVCPDALSMPADEVEDAVPLGWYVRIQFDELLDPELEELLPIPDSDLFEGSLLKSQPVVLSCGGVNVPYDGYYNPSGNSFTWPLGPGPVIFPLDDTTIPTGSECTLMIKPDVIADKDGEHVPAAQLGPYNFKIANLALAATDPGQPRDLAKPGTVAPEDPLVLTFNAQIDVASLDAAEVTILEITLPSDTAKCTDADVIAAGIPRTAVISPHVINAKGDVDLTSIEISDAAAPTDAAFEEKKTYLITFVDGADVTQDITPGGTATLKGAADLSICFKTDMLTP